MLHSLLRVGVCRLHTSSHLYAVSVDKATLSKLRKKTGISFINCKKALQKFNNDFTQAREWLREEALREGWTKASKLENRPMSSGLIGLKVDQNCAIMVEVNCETDFVAKNDKFRLLVSSVTSACISHGRGLGQSKLLLDTDALKLIPGEGNKSLADILALEIGNIGENMSLRRAVYLQVADNMKLGSYVHSSVLPVKDGKIRFGRYGALVVFSQQNEMDKELSTDSLGVQLGQHIVGMNPKTLGSMEDVDPDITDPDDLEQTPDTNKPIQDTTDLDESKQNLESTDPDSETKTEDLERSDESGLVDEDLDSRLFQQEFLLDTSLTVRDVLNMNSAMVEDFVRFECGEPIESEEE